MILLMRELHYPFNWIRFLEINKLCNVIAKNLTFSTNQKLISISWKVWTCSNFSTNWKWKWMNRIRHGRKNLEGKQKFELIWKIILKWQVKKLGFRTLGDLFWREEQNLWNILLDNYKIRQEKEKSVKECQKN